MANKIVRAPLFSDNSDALVEPGSVWYDEGGENAYRYILVEDANLAKGDVVEYSDTSGYEVSKDRSGGASIGRVVAGVAITTVTDGQYGWIQVAGRHTSVKTDGAVTAGQNLVPHATVDGVADSEANGSTVAVTSGQIFGRALAADAGTTSAGTVVAMLRCI